MLGYILAHEIGHLLLGEGKPFWKGHHAHSVAQAGDG